MKEAIPTKLQDKRFNISPESMKMMQDTKEMFLKLQEKFPELEAMSFYGSRIRGQEKSNSDLDFIIFEDRKKRLKNNNGPEFDQVLSEEVRRYYNEKGIVTPHKDFLTVFGVEEIEYCLKKLKDLIEVGLSHIHQDYTFDQLNHLLMNPFLLSVGNIYEIRKSILDALEKQERGEEYYSDLMRQLQIIERSAYGRKDQDNLPQYEYPKTIAEGKKYFLRNKQL